MAIDLVPIRVGEGGTGSGIWTYAYELIHHMDKEDLQNLRIFCLVNSGQVPFLSHLNNIHLIRFPELGKCFFLRLLWVHVLLPFICLFYRIGVLHKLATETPAFCPIKRVTTVHDFFYEYLFRQHSNINIRLYERMEYLYFSFVTKLCFGKSQTIIAVSDATRQEAVQRYPKSNAQIRVIHHGSRHPAPQNPRAELNKGFFKVLCVAKFMKHKGQHVLIDAFFALLEQEPELAGSVRLVLRGFHNDAEYYRVITEKISESRFSDNIEIRAYNSSDSLQEIYEDADLVVLLSGYEGFGLPVLEAQSLEIPVLCSDLPVLKEVGGDGATYVDREKMHDTAAALRRFINDPSYYERMRELAGKNTDRFSWKVAACKTLNVYHNC